MAARAGEPVCVHLCWPSILTSGGQCHGEHRYREKGRGEPPAGQRGPAHLHHAPHPHHPDHLVVQTPEVQVPARNWAGDDLW